MGAASSFNDPGRWKEIAALTRIALETGIPDPGDGEEVLAMHKRKLSESDSLEEHHRSKRPSTERELSPAPAAQ